MTNNDLLRRLRYALDISDPAMLSIFKLYDYEIDQATLAGLLKKEDEPDCIACSDALLGLFLDGLILHRRGGEKAVRTSTDVLTNNDRLKKIRIALELKEEDMLQILELAEIRLSKSELSALFRKQGHKNYRECGDQFLRNFMNGLTKKYRG